MSGYRDFSEFYDQFMTDVDYAAYAAYLISLFEKHGTRPQTVLDLACGSGSLSAELQKLGVDPIGVDASEGMLARAAEKLPNELLLCQDMRDLDLYGTVDGAVCTLDSLNHLSGTDDLAQVFRRMRLFVEPGGLFIFDMNTPYKHREVLADRAFVMEEDGVVCTWRTRYVPRGQRVDMLLDFFVEEQDGRYERYQDTVSERAYSLRTVTRLLSETGWDTVAVYEEATTQEPAPDCKRWVFVARSNRTEAEARGE